MYNIRCGYRDVAQFGSALPWGGLRAFFCTSITPDKGYIYRCFKASRGYEMALFFCVFLQRACHCIILHFFCHLYALTSKHFMLLDKLFICALVNPSFLQ